LEDDTEVFLRVFRVAFGVGEEGLGPALRRFAQPFAVGILVQQYEDFTQEGLEFL
jgi:hypothetical protein